MYHNSSILKFDDRKIRYMFTHNIELSICYAIDIVSKWFVMEICSNRYCNFKMNY